MFNEFSNAGIIKKLYKDIKIADEKNKVLKTEIKGLKDTHFSDYITITSMAVEAGELEKETNKEIASLEAENTQLRIDASLLGDYHHKELVELEKINLKCNEIIEGQGLIIRKTKGYETRDEILKKMEAYQEILDKEGYYEGMGYMDNL
tara:strand:+ start:75 stop:521 length:447 start_codon:yes stop_codon:yes gene_type:complete